MTEEIVVYGSGGHAKVIIDIIEESKNYSIVGICDDFNKDSKLFLGKYKYLMREEAKKVKNAVIAIGDNEIRFKVYGELNFHQFPVLIHPKATVSSSARIGNGTVVMAGVIVNAYVKVGEQAVINTAAVIEHDCELHDFSFVGPNAVLGGSVKLGKKSFVGLGASVKQGVTIEENSLIAMGSVLIQDIASHKLVAGVPAKIKKERKEGQKFF